MTELKKLEKKIKKLYAEADRLEERIEDFRRKRDKLFRKLDIAEARQIKLELRD